MTENMKKYMELVKKDETLKKKIAESEAKLAEHSMKNAIAFAAENGITLTPADFAANGELTDDELEAAAGGCWLCDCYKEEVEEFMNKADTDYIYGLIYKDKHGKMPGR